MHYGRLKMSSTLKSKPAFFGDPIHRPFDIDVPQVARRGRGLLIHGFPGTPAEMRPAATALAEAGVSGAGIQLPGLGPDIGLLGETEHTDWLAAAQQAWRETQQVTAATEGSVLVGFSMGGAIALHLAHQLKPSCLILIAPFWRFGPLWLQLLLPIVPYFKPTVSSFETGSLDDPDFRASLLDMAPGLDLDDPAVVEELKEQMVMPTRLINGIRSIGKEAYRLASNVSCPVLVIQGEEDTVVQPRLTRRIVRRLQRRTDVTFVSLSGGHTLPKQAGPFQEHIKAFVAEHL